VSLKIERSDEATANNQLLLIDAMAVSDQEEDNEVAEILQHQLYYNGDVLDSSLEVVAKYKDQSVA
jgi:replication fork protection complex subunit Tof1/Swi1